MGPKANMITVSYSELGFARLAHICHIKIEAILLGFHVEKIF